MEKSITIEKGQRTTKLTLMTESFKVFDNKLLEELESKTDFDKFFGPKYTVAKKTFKVTVKIEEIL
ncbi:hypothetical protein [Leeuwenhoekiella sp. MAR_2009_132]|uniref:hypothetical protein n=1 Tax=Leeuwenhoekiella sp. MAR_2009_132 TaxID=1392489 RepID=UPI000492050C|nr:hypothetical protein [Leeuwenhoekiella sp. MAR_2009_132]